MQKLLVLENESNHLFLEKLMAKMDFLSPIFFHHSSDALDWCLANPVDIVLIGCRLPIATSLDFLADLQRILNNQNIPIIMIASQGALEIKLRALELGVTDFVSVPVEQMELVMRIKNAVKFRLNQKNYLLAQNRIHELQKLEFMDCLTAGVAHEFNNILYIIGGYTDLTALTIEDMDNQLISIDELKSDVLSNSEKSIERLSKVKHLLNKC